MKFKRLIWALGAPSKRHHGFTLHLLKPGTKRQPACGAKTKLWSANAYYIASTPCKRCQQIAEKHKDLSSVDVSAGRE